MGDKNPKSFKKQNDQKAAHAAADKQKKQAAAAKPVPGAKK